jgi:hypothetical protein
MLLEVTVPGDRVPDCVSVESDGAITAWWHAPGLPAPPERGHELALHQILDGASTWRSTTKGGSRGDS